MSIERLEKTKDDAQMVRENLRQHRLSVRDKIYTVLRDASRELTDAPFPSTGYAMDYVDEALGSVFSAAEIAARRDFNAAADALSNHEAGDLQKSAVR